MEVFPVELRRELWADARHGATASSSSRHGPASRGLQLLDIETYLPGDLLLKADLASMAHSLELRSPFLDHEVVALGLALPDSLKTRGREGKVALRRAFAADLPPRSPAVARPALASRSGAGSAPTYATRRMTSCPLTAAGSGRTPCDAC